MKLKKLEISGFKSFIDKATIQFPAGISAIVGPNGCGKSNVVDALRWVMGEQSVKQLRGKSMEDVIFAGSNGKPPLNMAEVTLTLHNDNGSAPVELKDFTEIMVTRRLYRSGESAYFINKRPCRLKDINNIFLGSGMGAKTYAVVQQGNIGAITDAGPEERRVFIEEAAGVTRFKTRKIEALRKVESTNQNLLRLNDIIVEIGRQMNSLKRQAKKAERFKKYKNRVKGLDVRLAAYHYDQFSQQLTETDVLLTDLKDADANQSSKLKRIDAAIEQIKLKRLEKNQEIASQKSQQFETQRRIDRMETDLDHIRKDIERLTDEVAELESARAGLASKNKEIISEIAQVEEQNSAFKQELNALAAALEQERLKSQGQSDRMADLNRKLDQHKADLMELVTQEARYKNIYQNATNNRESLQRRLKRVDEEEALADQEVAQALASQADAQKQLQQCEQALADLSRQIEATRKQLDMETQRLGQQVKVTQTLEFERGKAKSQYAALKKMEANFEWYKDGVRAVMQRTATNPEVPGKVADTWEPAQGQIIGLMADILEPEASYETAVEAVLGESLQYILVKDQQVGSGAIDFLQRQGSGRSGFIPFTGIKTMENAGKLPDASKLLLNHVSVRPEFESIAQALLGHVVVAADLAEALDIYNRNGTLQTVVTKDGQVVSHQGVMIGGSQDKLSGILAKKQELKQLEKRIAKQDSDLIAAHKTQKDLEEGVRRTETQLQQLLEQQHGAIATQTETEKALYRASEALKHARRHLDIVHLEQERLLGEESDIDEEMVKYNQAIAEVTAQVKTAQELVSATAQSIGAFAVEVERLNKQIVDLKLQKTAITAQLENSDNTLRRLKEFQGDGVLRLEQIAQEITQKRQKREAYRQKIGEFDQLLAQMYSDLQGLEKTLECNEADFQAIESELTNNDLIISEIQNQREEALQKIRMLEVERSQLHLKRENIAARIVERYHQPLTELEPLLAPEEGSPEMSPQEMEAELVRLKERIERIGDVNLAAIKEYDQLKTRFDFLIEQRDDLIKALDDLQKVIHKINRITQKRFMETFDQVNEKLNEVFPRLFEGGTAKLVLTDPNDPLETGVEFMIHPPGKKLTRMSLLSGGEKALSAIAFIFSIFLIKPTSFCLMDEIDAPLDEANVYRFNNLLKIIGEKSQVIMITHNKKTMEFADTLFGITMEHKGISKIVSVNFSQPN
jgi:chromosome segregation protein